MKDSEIEIVLLIICINKLFKHQSLNLNFISPNFLLFWILPIFDWIYQIRTNISFKRLSKSNYVVTMLLVLKLYEVIEQLLKYAIWGWFCVFYFFNSSYYVLPISILETKRILKHRICKMIWSKTHENLIKDYIAKKISKQK